MNATPAWSGELRMAFEDIDRITFYKHMDEEPEGKLRPGVRYMAVFVEIGDDEQPRSPLEREALRERRRMPSNVAAILCKDADFQRYAAGRMNGLGRGEFEPTESTATRFIYEACEIKSRADLDLNEEAMRRFQDVVEMPFYRDRQLGEI